MKRLYIAVVAALFLASAVSAAEVGVLKPKGNLNLQIGHPSTISLYEVPTQMTHERLNKHGWNVKSVEFIRTDLNSQALAQGTVQMAISQILDPLRAIQKGARVVFLMENNGGEFVMIARRDIADCKGVDGKRFAIHGETSTISLAVRIWVERECKVNPKIVVIPGGENRIVALRNDQVDATLVQLGDWLTLDSQAPGRFHVILTGGPFNISGASLWANTDWLKKNEAVATAYVIELLKTFRMIHADPRSAEAAVRKYVSDTPKEVVPRAVKAYLDIVRAWPQNGGDTGMVEETIRFFTERGELKPGLNVKDIADMRILANALKKSGRVEGAR